MRIVRIGSGSGILVDDEDGEAIDLDSGLRAVPIPDVDFVDRTGNTWSVHGCWRLLPPDSEAER